MTTSIHIPVLLKETTDLLDPKPGDVVVDGTVGGGGHSAEIARRTGGDVQLHCFDADSSAIGAAAEAIAAAGCANARFYNMNFRNAAEAVTAAGAVSLDRVVLDLGLRSDQLEGSGRGFSFLRDEPLLMTFSDTLGEDDVTARSIVNGWSEEDLANVFYGYGDERYSRRIASAIVEARKVHPIERTSELVVVIEGAVPKSYARGRIHPATRVFQALRIAVNDEYGALTDALRDLWKLVRPGGRLAVISFQSGEDRIVKRFMQERVKVGEGKLVVKKPVIPEKEEIDKNPRSRSAKLRAIERVTLEEKIS